MEPTDLEKDLLAEFFKVRGIDSECPMRSFSAVEVTKRSFTGAGFFTNFSRHDSLRVPESDRTYSWGEIGGILNREVHVGFQFYVDEGYIATIEGFTYEWPAWPEKIDCYELFKEEIRKLGNVNGENRDSYRE